MLAYKKLYNILEGDFYGCELNHVARANNTEADELANIGSTHGPVPPGVFLESIYRRSIKPAKPLKSTTTIANVVASTGKKHLPPPSK